MHRSIRVGIFVLLGILLTAGMVFLIGDARNFWQSKVTYQASFADVAGLKTGAPVRMGGVDVGAVTRVGHSPKLDDSRVYVTVSIVRSESTRVRVDTVANVTNKGLLGDKMIELSTDGVGGPLPEGQALKTDEPIDLSKYLSKVEDIMNKASAAVDNVEKGTRPFADPQFADDVKATTHDLREIMDGIAHNDSMVHRALLDPKEGEKFDRIVTNAETATSNVSDVTAQVKQGPGIAHALLYDGEMSANAAGTLSEVHQDLLAVRQGNGIVHALIYGDSDTQHVMGNVNAMSDDLRTIVANLKAGKGTLGALLVDPSVYEDIKAVVGNVDRNDVLRALVRYSIKADESHPKARVAP
jgi:phospholipid/cholesterol/gamma-HCH transport system substrate-binding protein